MLKYNVTMDLCADYSKLVTDWLKCQGVKSNKTGRELWYEFFNLQMKTINPKKRRVLYSKEFSCPSDLQQGLRLLVNKFETGQDVSCHLSKKASSPAEFDELLYDWGIYHLHLGEEIDKKTGYIERTGPVLFVKIDNEKVYFINVYSHGKGVEEPWYKQEMLKILHDNWPYIIADCRISDRVMKIQHFSDNEYGKLRKNHISVINEVAENAVYTAPGGGYMLSGHSMELVMLCQKIEKVFRDTENHIRKNISNYANYIETHTAKLGRKDFHFSLWFESGELYVVDSQSMIKLLDIQLK